METLKKLAPFMLKSRVVEVGRDRLLQIRKQLAFLLVTTDLSENSREAVLREFPCPVYQCLTSGDIEQIFGFHGTKIVGFHRSPLASSVLPDLRMHLLDREALKNAPAPLPTSPKVAILGASGIGRHHSNWWNMEGAQPVAFLGSTAESVATTAELLATSFGIHPKGYTDLQTLLDEAQPDIVDVCLPPALHYQAAKTALEAGCNVLCEKPFVYDDNLEHEQLLAQAKELEELATAKRKMLGVCTQYIMAEQECLALFSEHTKLEKPAHFQGTLISPTRNRPPVPHWTWVDLSPHMLAVAQALSQNGRINWKTLKTEFTGHQARAIFDCERRDGSLLHCDILTLHRDEEPKNVRQITIDGNTFDIGGYKDDKGVFNMRISTPWGSVDREDMLRLLIRSYLKGKIEMTAPMARRNLEWMLYIIAAAGAFPRP